MYIRNMPLPEDFPIIDTSKLEFVDGWAFAAAKNLLTGGTSVYFIADEQTEKNLTHQRNAIGVSSHIVISVATEYFKKHEQTFRAGIKETAKQLAYDRFYEKALEVIPTSFYVFDKDFMTNFEFQYKLSLRKSRLSEARKNYFMALKNKTILRQIETLKTYDAIKSSSADKAKAWNKKELSRQKILN